MVATLTETRHGGFLEDPDPEPSKRGGTKAAPTQIRCFICQRITREKYYGGKVATNDCGVWFQNQDCWSKCCWCPQCQFELNEPEEAMQMWPTKDPVFRTSRWREATGLTEAKAGKFKRDKWMDPEGGPEAAQHLDVITRRILQDILQGPPPPPRLAPQAPPGLGRQEQEAARPTTTTSTSASPAPSRYSRDDLERRVNDLSREVERQNDLVSRYMDLASNLERYVKNAFFTISELTNESRNLPEENNKYKEYIQDQLPIVMDDVIALRDQVASLEPLKDQVRNLEQELDSLRREVIIPAGTFDSPRSFCSQRSGLWEA